ncbi:hypothetical protein ACIBJD_37135 [Kitasatospora sp. NPDC050467]|uniref:hypothetical protein n=1 Tax=Kitasatospora sp. NPDC050467 TaxID=3364053 RepID=UPI0037A0950E
MDQVLDMGTGTAGDMDDLEEGVPVGEARAGERADGVETADRERQQVRQRDL